MKKWFGGKADVDDLVARGKFGLAIEELEKRLEAQPPHLESDSVEIVPFRDQPDRPTATSAVDPAWSERLQAQQGDFGWSPVLEGLPAEVFAKVVGRLKLLIKNPGAIICAEGERAASLFVLARGFARVYRCTGDGRQRQVMVLEEGRFFGEEALLERGPRRPITVTAASECEILEIDLEELGVILSVNPKARERLERSYSQRIWRR